MPAKKKQFIDKKNAVTFHLVHRSQRDPLQASEEASQHVLVQGNVEKKKEEERKFGVFYEDNYDYMQHLKDLEEIHDVEPVAPARAEKEINLNLPSSVFGSKVERETGLLNEAVAIKGPRPDWDPDIVEALDEDFDFEDPDKLLDDDFVVKANKVPEFKSEEVDKDDDDQWSDCPSDEAAMSGDFDSDYEYGDKMFMDEETKSRFTNYSMSSSVIRRSQGLTLLDDRFEKLYEGYDDSEIGALDQEEIDGTVQQTSEVLSTIMEEFEKQEANKRNLKDMFDQKEDQEEVVVSESDSDDSEEDLVKITEPPKEKWDCESILSTYSNLYNHPKLIEEPRKVQKIVLKGPYGIPADVLQARGLTKKEIDQDLRAKERMDKVSTYRPKGETTDERNERKKALKQERRERRQEKKINKQAFSEENQRQKKEVLNIQLNLTGIKII